MGVESGGNFQPAGRQQRQQHQIDHRQAGTTGQQVGILDAVHQQTGLELQPRLRPEKEERLARIIQHEGVEQPLAQDHRHRRRVLLSPQVAIDQIIAKRLQEKLQEPAGRRIPDWPGRTIQISRHPNSVRRRPMMTSSTAGMPQRSSCTAARPARLAASRATIPDSGRKVGRSRHARDMTHRTKARGRSSVKARIIRNCQGTTMTR